jgi:hypothetical protein
MVDNDHLYQSLCTFTIHGLAPAAWYEAVAVDTAILLDDIPKVDTDPKVHHAVILSICENQSLSWNTMDLFYLPDPDNTYLGWKMR